MHDITVYPAVPGRLSGWVQRRSFTKASVARRSERAPLNVARFVIPNVDTDGRFGWALFSTYAFLLMQDIESTAPAHGAVVARASSSSPRTMFNTSPKPRREPHAPLLQTRTAARALVSTDSSYCKAELEHASLSVPIIMSILVNPVYIGIDVAKATLQVDLPGSQIEFRNSPKGLNDLCKKLQAISGAHVICEADWWL